MEEDPLLAELHRKVLVTSRCRFHASHRLKYHQHLSQWTIALISIVLIILPLVSFYKLNTSINSSYFEILQVGFAILILVYSLLLGALSFDLRSDKLHQCGVELHKLAYKISNSRMEKYRYLYSEYNDIVDKHENHKNNDYLVVKLTLRDQYYKSGAGIFFDFILSRFYLFLEYIVYLIVPSIILKKSVEYRVIIPSTLFT